jgi:N-acetylglucosaminyldiphosphoundecaprenol N-acetyl-beta-D-mannosaminyltransferase
VYGPDLTLAVCRAAAEEGIPVGFYGSTDETLSRLIPVMTEQFPGLDVAYRYSPPFRSTTESEDASEVRAIEASGARILFVGLGCPKQEKWVIAHKGRVPCVMLAVGAAFDFHAGTVKQAPGWMQRLGLEWMFRFMREPRRLWKRYLKHNPRYVVLVLLQLLGLGRHTVSSHGA